MRRYQSLDAIRLVCAAVVVAHHVTMPPYLQNALGPEGAKLALGAFFGPTAVVVFFAISGFCIHRPMTERIDWRGYYIRRFGRILPPLIAIIAVGWLVGVSYHPYEGWVTWSLICEAVYYAIYPALRAAVRKFGWLVVLATSTLVAALVTLTMLDAQSYAAMAFRDTVSLFVVWAGGCWLAERQPKFAINAWWMRIAIGVSSMGIATLHYLGIATYRYSLAAFGLLAIVWISRELEAKWPQWMERAGLATYSLYLVHPAAFYGFVQSRELTNTTWIIGVFLVVAATPVFYFFVERPSARLSHRWAGSTIKHHLSDTPAGQRGVTDLEPVIPR